MNEAIFRALTYYFKALRSLGYKNYNEVFKVIFLSCVSEIVENDFNAELSEEDYRDINNAVYKIYGTDCMFPYPKNNQCDEHGDPIITVPDDEEELSEEDKIKKMENDLKIQELQETIEKLKANLSNTLQENNKLRGDIKNNEESTLILQKSLAMVKEENETLQTDKTNLTKENTSLTEMLESYFSKAGISKEDNPCDPSTYQIGVRMKSSEYLDRNANPVLEYELYDNYNSSSDFKDKLKSATLVFFVTPTEPASQTRKYMSDVSSILNGKCSFGIMNGDKILGYDTNGETLKLNIYAKTSFSFIDNDGNESRGSNAIEKDIVFYASPTIEPTYTATNVSLKCTTPITENVTSKQLTYTLYKNDSVFKTANSADTNYTFTVSKADVDEDDKIYAVTSTDLTDHTGMSSTLTINLDNFK